MPGEVKTKGPGTGMTCYFLIRGSGSSVWSTSGGTGGFEGFDSDHWTDYDVALTEQGASNIYVGNFPAAVPAGVFDIDARQQAAGSPAQTDNCFAGGEVEWDGTKRLPLSDLATSGLLARNTPVRLARSEMVLNFPLYLKSAADHVTPFVSGVVSGQIWRDGATTPSALQSGAFTEVGRGFYNLQALTSGDVDAVTVKLLFTANGVSGGTSDPLPMAFVMQRSSG
jgi:hypothetical protein